MNELIESGDPRAKVVGKRRMPNPGIESLTAGGQLNRLAGTLRAKPFETKHGVYRFKTHEEADEWMMNLMLGKS
ncbi:MAG: hypothetical protein Q8Q59_12930 [Luteolibacter sp.]|nr:hypothetical protein [Luteolibacter sp.]